MWCPRCNRSSHGYACANCGISERELAMGQGPPFRYEPTFTFGDIPLPIDPPGFDASAIQSIRKPRMQEIKNTDIKQHEGSKYLRLIRPASRELDPEGKAIHVDVYCVLDAFEVKDQAVGHAIKKLPCAGERGKGNRLEDLVGAIAAINRAIDFEKAARWIK